MRSKRGTYLIEAAVVFPIIIITVITVILIIMYFYQCSATQSDMHRYLRNEAGISSGKRICYSDESEREYYCDYSRNSISASEDVYMIHNGILYSYGHRTIRGKVHINNGTRYVLRRQLINDQ